MEFAHVYVVRTEKKEIAEIRNLYERTGEESRVKFNPQKHNVKIPYFLEDGEKMERVFVFQMAESKEKLERVIQCDSEGSKRTIRIPKRKSLGDLQLPVSMFRKSEDVSAGKSDEDATEKAKKKVQQERAMGVLKKLQNCNMTTKGNETSNAAISIKGTNDDKSMSGMKCDKNSTIKKTNKKVNSDKKNVSMLKETNKKVNVEMHNPASKEKERNEEDAKNCNKTAGTDSSIGENKMNELKSQKVAFDNDDIKEDRNESVSSKTFVVAKSGKPEKGLDKDTTTNSIGQLSEVLQISDVTANNDCERNDMDELNNIGDGILFKPLLKRASTPVNVSDSGKRMKMECVSEHCLTIKKSLEERILTLELENNQLKSTVEKQSEQYNVIINMNNNLQNLCSALTEQGNANCDERKDKKKVTGCKISLASNITDEEGIEVPASQIYIGNGVFIVKSDLIRVGLKKPKNFKTRMEGVVSLIWPDGTAQGFSLKGSDKKTQVEDYQVHAVHKLLNLMSWKNIVMKPLKINKRMIEPLTVEHVKRKLGIFLSELHKPKPKKRKDGGGHSKEDSDEEKEMDDEMEKKKTDKDKKKKTNKDKKKKTDKVKKRKTDKDNKSKTVEDNRSTDEDEMTNTDEDMDTSDEDMRKNKDKNSSDEDDKTDKDKHEKETDMQSDQDTGEKTDVDSSMNASALEITF